MNILSHGLWSGIAFGRAGRKEFFWAFFFGIAPDLCSFGLFTGSVILGMASGLDWSNGPPDPALVPQYVHSLYDVTHSFFVAAVVLGIVFAINKKIWLPLFAWPLHVLMDIPTHSTRFFPTPFLWPISEYRVNGVSWATPAIFYTDIVLLGMLYSFWFFKKRNR